MRNDLARRTGPRLWPDPRRVIGQLFVPGEETPHSRSRAEAVLGRLLALSDADVVILLEETLPAFADRHADLSGMLLEHFAMATHGLPDAASISRDRQMLIGASFTSEYAPESAALFNPSIAPHPDQSGVEPGELRFIMTVRCVGEGHLSSIGFRTGTISPSTDVTVDAPSRTVQTGARSVTRYERTPFSARLAELGVDRVNIDLLTGDLPDPFSADDLAASIDRIHDHTSHREPVQRAVGMARFLIEASYERHFASDTPLSGRLLWPGSSSERHGMEDARMVRLVEADGSVAYVATYTAYDGTNVATQLWRTTDFTRFSITPVAGKAARNKGLALFPRQIGGRYLALSRWDRESLAIVESDRLTVWDEPTPLYAAARGWEAIQIGNGGSPIETADGWLVLTHGVGPMRRYSLGAILLDLDDPCRVLATLPWPLLTPADDERDGYVPNVVYTCGAILHNGVLTIPYGTSDTAIGFAQLPLADLIAAMLPTSR